MSKVEMYSTRLCPYCMAAKRLLASKGVDYVDYEVDADFERREEMMSRSGRTSVPQIFIDDVHVGGFDELAELDAEDALDPMLGLDAKQ